MSKMVGSCPEFEKKCSNIAHDVLSAGTNNIYCQYEGSTCSKRDFALRARRSLGYTYHDWDEFTKEELIKKLREAGATNIIGYVKWNRVDLAFDIKKSVLKQYRGEEFDEEEN